MGIHLSHFLTRFRYEELDYVQLLTLFEALRNLSLIIKTAVTIKLDLRIATYNMIAICENNYSVYTMLLQNKLFLYCLISFICNNLQYFNTAVTKYQIVELYIYVKDIFDTVIICLADCFGNGEPVLAPDCEAECRCFGGWVGEYCQILVANGGGDPHLETLDG